MSCNSNFYGIFHKKSSVHGIGCVEDGWNTSVKFINRKFKLHVYKQQQMDILESNNYKLITVKHGRTIFSK